MRLRQAAYAAAILSTFVVPAVAADRVSGPKVGSHVTPFDVDDITGPNKGKQLCYV